jgi:hypothetical protein
VNAFIAALSLTIASTAALAQTGKPFEQLDIDRAVPNVSERQAGAPVYMFGGSAPFEQLSVDRAQPNIEVGQPTRLAAFSGETRSDAEIAVATQSSLEVKGDTSPFANEWSFIAPAQ